MNDFKNVLRVAPFCPVSGSSSCQAKKTSAFPLVAERKHRRDFLSRERITTSLKRRLVRPSYYLFLIPIVSSAQLLWNLSLPNFIRLNLGAHISGKPSLASYLNFRSMWHFCSALLYCTLDFNRPFGFSKNTWIVSRRPDLPTKISSFILASGLLFRSSMFTMLSSAVHRLNQRQVSHSFVLNSMGQHCKRVFLCPANGHAPGFSFR